MSILDRARPEIRALKPYASARSLAGAAPVSLDANENPWAPMGGEELDLNRYPDPQPAELKQALVELYGVGPSQLLLTRGSDEAIDLLVRAFCPAGDSAVLQCPPCFGMYAVAARIQGAELVDVPLRAEQGFALDAAQVARQARIHGVRLVFLCSPNNPTGNTLDREAVLDLCRSLSDLAVVVVDEAYGEFTQDASFAGHLSEFENLAVLRTLSKAWALAGLRCGALLASQGLVDLLLRIIPPYPVPRTTAEWALQHLDETARSTTKNRVQRLREIRDAVKEKLAVMPFVRRVWPSEANFLLIEVEDGAGVYRHAADHGVLLRDVSHYPGLANCLRISIGTEDQMERLLEVFRLWGESA